MILTIDIGNTKVKWGIFENKQIIYSIILDEKDNITKKILSIKKYNLNAVIISSVVPESTPIYKNVIEKELNIAPLIVNNINSKLILEVDKPETVGADRLCNIKAAIKLYSTPAIIIDFGTATTFDVINLKNKFVGGIISPGIETSAQYLIDKAALLDKTDFKFPKKIIGKNTKTNIQSGIMFGAIDQIEGLVNRVNQETKTKNNIILTGGFSKLLAPHFSFNHTLDIDLTLKGMIYIYESNS